MASREIDDLIDELKEKYLAFKKSMDDAGIPFALTCTARLYYEQVALYAQGRESIQAVNLQRKIARMPPITEQENKKRVTWTLDSKHIVGLKRDKSEAFDIVLLKDGKTSWDIKADVNDNEIPDYDEAGKIGESVGLKWGGRFKSPDRPHFQV